MSSLLITPSLSEAIVTAADAAKLRRDDLLKTASLVTTVSDRLDADDATIVLKAIKEFTREIEKQKTVAKAPVLEIGRKIDAMTKVLISELESHASRISRVLGSFEAEEQRKAHEARLAAEAEAARIAYEAAEEAKKAQRAGITEEAGMRAADAVVEAAQEKIVAVRQTAVNATPLRQAGSQLRSDVCFEVTDIKALYAAHPELVVLEPNGTAIRAICRANPNLQVPGLRHWKEAKLNVR